MSPQNSKVNFDCRDKDFIEEEMNESPRQYESYGNDDADTYVLPEAKANKINKIDSE